MTKTNVQPIPSNSQHHDTPNNKTHVIKFRVTAEEKASLELTLQTPESLPLHFYPPSHSQRQNREKRSSLPAAVKKP